MLAAVTGLWIVYLVPQLLRHRRQLVEARVDDRFSEHLRVLRVAEPVPAPTGTHVPSQGRVQLHPRGGDRAMDRPQSVADRVSADAARLTADEHAARARALARRAAGARRRARLVAALLLATRRRLGGGPGRLAAGHGRRCTTLLLAAVLVAGRRAVLAGQRADAAWAAGAARRAARPMPRGHRAPVAVGHAVHPSEAITEIMEKVPVGPARAAAQNVLATGEVPVVADEPLPVGTAGVLRGARGGRAGGRGGCLGRGRRLGPGPGAAADLRAQARGASSGAAPADRSAAVRARPGRHGGRVGGAPDHRRSRPRRDPGPPPRGRRVAAVAQPATAPVAPAARAAVTSPTNRSTYDCYSSSITVE